MKCVGRHARRPCLARVADGCPTPAAPSCWCALFQFHGQPGVPLSRIHPELMVGSCDDTVTIVGLVLQCGTISV